MENLIVESKIKKHISELDKIYDIHLCKLEEIDDITKFIDLYWKKGHVLVRDIELLKWQHLNAEKKRYNFVVARRRENNDIDAVLGFIPTRHFDKEIKVLKIWPALWTTKPNLKVMGLGLSLFYFLDENFDIEAIEYLGNNRDVLRIYENMGFRIGKMRHYYMINPSINNYHILKNVPSNFKSESSQMVNKNVRVKKINKIAFRKIKENIFNQIYKSKEFYINRFFNHPTYKYSCYVISKSNIIKAFFFTRTCHANNTKCIRLVEYCGDKDVFVYTNNFFNNLVIEKKAEYIDFIFFGWKEKILLSAGFMSRDNSDIIIPNYFEPFERKNIYLSFASKSINENSCNIEIYKADADQDRPNL